MLNDLINKLCPNGVEYKKLNELLTYEQPQKYIVNENVYNDLYNIPVLTAGKSFILGYTNDEKGIYKASKVNPVIIFDDFTTSFRWIDFDFKVKSSALKFLKQTNKIHNFKYIYYCMNTIKYMPKTHERQWIKKYSHFPIPIRPLEIQNEIVNILDKFSTLCDDLISSLPAEIEMRKKQYEYYRDQLLTFNEKKV